MTNDDKIKDLFTDFRSELSSSRLFMTKLQQSMAAAEIVRQHQMELKRRNRLAVAIAALCGFISGVALSILLPKLGDWVSTFSISIPQLHVGTITMDFSPLAWIITAGTSSIIALNAYEITLNYNRR